MIEYAFGRVERNTVEKEKKYRLTSFFAFLLSALQKPFFMKAIKTREILEKGQGLWQKK